MIEEMDPIKGDNQCETNAIKYDNSVERRSIGIDANGDKTLSN